MTKPVEYLKFVRGFGTWRIVYDAEVRKWRLTLKHWPHGKQWLPVSRFDVAEAAAEAVGERKTGYGGWDPFGYGRGMNFDLSSWEAEASEGVQADARDEI